MSGSSDPSNHDERTVSPSIKKALRSAFGKPAASPSTPKPEAASPRRSDSSGTVSPRPSDSAHARCDHGESSEIPNGRMPAEARSALLSRRSRSSFAQVGDQSNG